MHHPFFFFLSYFHSCPDPDAKISRGNTLHNSPWGRPLSLPRKRRRERERERERSVGGKELWRIHSTLHLPITYLHGGYTRIHVFITCIPTRVSVYLWDSVLILNLFFFFNDRDPRWGKNAYLHTVSYFSFHIARCVYDRTMWLYPINPFPPGPSPRSIDCRSSIPDFSRIDH